MSSSPESYGNFDLVKRLKLDQADLTVSKWKSRETGLSVVHLDYEAPIVNGYFVVATEIFNDSGCPHTLEHLVFMGSEKYPYKGIIDHFANRGFSNGTNAWTDTDHTAYTVSTAGEDGFLQMLPIYVDHILYATLKKSGYTTEVHHIDSEGHNSGVVYSEMQGRENTSGDLMALRAQRLLYPEGNAYRSETGGLMEAIRKLSVEQIRDYHGTYYVPHNLSLIVAGKLSSTESLLSVVQEKVEPSIIAHGQNKGPRPEGWLRPFIETPSAAKPHLSKNISDICEFPEKDESMGELIINFLGPAPNSFLERKGLDLLGTYLTSSAVAPLNKEYVETDSPLCTYIYFSEDIRATHTSLPIYIGSVPTDQLGAFPGMLENSLKKIVKEGLDMQRMEMVINRDERQLRSKVESSKDSVFSGAVITDFLYGAEDGSELEPALDEFSLYEVVRKWGSKEWTDLLAKYYVDAQSVVVIGKPSATLADKLEENEKARLDAQVKQLGPEGLEAATKALEAAKAENDTPIPPEILHEFKIPSVKSISWIPVQSVQEPGSGRKEAASRKESDLSKHVAIDGKEVPFFIQYDHVESDFVQVRGVFSLTDVPVHLRPHVQTYLSAFFSLPVVRSNGEKLTHEEVINRLDDETVSYDVGLGVGSAFSETLRVSIKVETRAYETAVAWLKDLIYGAVFSKDRLQVTLAKFQQSLPELKRDGSTVLSSLWADSVYDESSTSRAGGILNQAETIPALIAELQENPDKVIQDFETIRTALTNPSGIRFSVSGNVLGLPNPRSTWEKHFGNIKSSSLSPVPLSSETLSKLGKNPVRKAVVLGLPTIESSFVTHTAKCIQGFDHPEYSTLRVTLEVLNATESYLWRYIRGNGLAYGAYVSLDLEAGLLSFSLYRSSNSVSALKEASNVINGLVNGTVTFDETVLDAAKSSIVYGVTKNVSNSSRATAASFTNQALKGVPQNYQVELLDKFQAVTKEDVLAALKKHFLPLFDPATSIATVVTAPGKVEGIVQSLKEGGFEVETRSIHIDASELEEYDSDESGSESEESDGSR